ncbi:MAG: BMP family ABC transporter substrate-binding protein, partial [Clostridium sp.]
MKKKLLKAIAVSAMSVMLLGGCGSSSSNTSGDNSIKAGMVTGKGSIDDKSFNQGTWEGLLKAQEEFNLPEPKYLQPNGDSEGDYLKEIVNLVDAGYDVIATAGFEFESPIYTAQEKYPNVKFLIIDGTPTKDEETKIADNTTSVAFAEEQAGFIAGVTAALQVKDGKVGFIGGMKIPSVIKFANGYVQGVDYANQ